MTGKLSNTKASTKNYTFLKILGLFIISFAVLFYYQGNKNRDIESNGIDSVAIVNYFKYISYIDNDKSSKRISFYRIGFDYHYNGSDYSSILELQPNEFKDKIGRDLKIGDKINIRHSMSKPKNVIIK